MGRGLVCSTGRGQCKVNPKTRTDCKHCRYLACLKVLAEKDDREEGEGYVQAGMVPDLVDAGLRRRREEEQADRRKEFSWVRNQGVKEEQNEQTPVVSIEGEERGSKQKELNVSACCYLVWRRWTTAEGSPHRDGGEEQQAGGQEEQEGDGR